MKEKTRSRKRQANRTHWAIIGLTFLLAGAVTMAGLAIVPQTGDKAIPLIESVLDEDPADGLEENQTDNRGQWIIDNNDDLLADAEEHGAIGEGTSSDPLVFDGERFTATNTTTFVLENTDHHVLIKDLSLNGTGSGTAIVLHNVTGVTFENLTVNHHHTALRATNTTHVTIQDSRFNENHIAVQLKGLQDSVISNNRFENNDRAVQATNMKTTGDEQKDTLPLENQGLLLIDNQIQQALPHWADEEKGPHGTGIELTGRDHQIVNNTIEGHEPSAIWTNGTNIAIQGNIIRIGPGYGISLDRTTNAILDGNTIDSRGQAAIMTHHTRNTQILGNTITDNSEGALKGNQDKGLQVANNTLDWNGPSLTLWFSSQASITGNQITGGDYALKTMDSDDTQIEDNRLRIFSSGAIAVFRGKGLEFTDNHVSESKEYNLFLIGTTDALVYENQLRSANHGIIVTEGADQIQIEDNRLFGRGSVGMRIVEADHVRLVENDVRFIDYGILIEKDSNDVKIQGGMVTHNQVGILFLNKTVSSTAKEVRVIHNKAGVKLENSQHIELTGLELEDNRRGIWFDYASNNTATGNLVKKNQIGLLMEQSTHNLFYDNVFNNSMARGKNAWLFGSPDNQWNIERTRGTNIIGGPYIGGNWWDSYIGTDGTGDGLGEIPHRPVPYAPALEGPMYDSGVPMGPFDLHPLVELD